MGQIYRCIVNVVRILGTHELQVTDLHPLPCESGGGIRVEVVSFPLTHGRWPRIWAGGQMPSFPGFPSPALLFQNLSEALVWGR